MRSTTERREGVGTRGRVGEPSRTRHPGFSIPRTISLRRKRVNENEGNAEESAEGEKCEEKREKGREKERRDDETHRIDAPRTRCCRPTG